MNITETTHALALAQAYDNRTVGEVNIRAWHAILSDCDVADVMEAIRQHYAESTEWMMPAHIRRAVRDMVSQRDMVRRATGWAPGQAGVPKDEAMPEVTGRIAEGELTPSVRALLDSVRAMLPEGSREALMPRRVAWEREHRAYRRTQDAEPNPLYRPPGDLWDPIPEEAGPERDAWLKSRGWDSYEQYVNRGAGPIPPSRPSAETDTGILPNAHRCADCSFTTADAERMNGHLEATGHLHE